MAAIGAKQITGTLCFPKVHVRPLRFYDNPTLIPVFMNWEKSEEDFHFLSKKAHIKLMYVFHKSEVA